MVAAKYQHLGVILGLPRKDHRDVEKAQSLDIGYVYMGTEGLLATLTAIISVAATKI